jgi:hypothetical protein
MNPYLGGGTNVNGKKLLAKHNQPLTYFDVDSRASMA